MSESEIGIVTFHRANNYGAALQCFALQYFLQQRFGNACVIDYRSPIIESQYIESINFGHSTNLTSKIKAALGWILRKSRLKKRNKKFLLFRNTFLSLSPTVKTPDNIPNGIKILIFGSDQIWSIKDEDFWWGKGTTASIRKIAFAASAGDKESNVQYFRKELNQFEAIGVREKSLKQILIKNGFNNVAINIDPTLLLSKKTWDEALPLKRLINDNYLLVYTLREKNKTFEFAQKIAKKKNLKLIEITGGVSRFPNNNRRETDGPIEFVSLIKYADAIVTNSFHGTVFSIIFEKPFWTIRLNDGCDNRASNLLEMLNLETRLTSLNDNPEEKEIDYSTVRNKKRILIEEASEFLKKNIL